MKNKIEEYQKILEAHIVIDVNDKPIIGQNGIAIVLADHEGEIKKKQKQLLIDFLDDLRDYIRESGNNLAHDERESKEFVEIFNKK